MIVYHGSSNIVSNPDLAHSRDNIDFGRGFYVTEDINMARKWACNKKTPILNSYTLDISTLKIKELQINLEWLKYVVANRKQLHGLLPFDDSCYDAIFGPTADDKMFETLDMFIDNSFSAEKTLAILTCMSISPQITLKTQKGLDALSNPTSKQIVGFEKDNFSRLFLNDSKQASELTRKTWRQPDLGKIFFDDWIQSIQESQQIITGNEMR